MVLTLSAWDCRLILEGLKLLDKDVAESLSAMQARNNEAIVCDTFRHSLKQIEQLKGRLTV